MKSLEDLQALRDKELARLGVRQGSDLEGKPVISVCMGTCGIAAGAREVLATLVESIGNENLSREVIVEQTDRPDLCEEAPAVLIEDVDGSVTTYVHITPEKAKELIEKHIKQSEVIIDYTR